MPALSSRSKRRLATCHPDLQKVVDRCIEIVPDSMDFTVLVGHRSKAAQDAAFAAGTSQLKWPRSKHNSTPSRAVDLAPYPIDWEDLERFKMLGTYMYRAAQDVGVSIRWGGHWSSLRDYPHYELE